MNAPTPHTMPASFMRAVQRAPETAQPPLGRVRGVVWMALALAIVVAMAVPAGVYYQAATSALSAHVCLWPATPRANAPARLLIVVAPGRDSADAQTPLAQAQAEWDMLTMAMGAKRAATSGSANDAGAFVVPLAISMAGPWRAEVSLQAPGRPGWHGRIDFTALAAGSSSAPAAPSFSQLLLACHVKGAST